MMKNKNEHIQVYYVKQGTHANGKFIKTPGTSPVAAIALVWDDSNAKFRLAPEIARGVYLPQFGEQFCKATARKHAISRARKALYGGLTHSDFDKKHGVAKRFIDCYAVQFQDDPESIDILSTAEALAELTNHETTLIRIHYDKLNGVKAPVAADVKAVKATKKVAAIKKATTKKAPAKKAKVRMMDLEFVSPNQ